MCNSASWYDGQYVTLCKRFRFWIVYSHVEIFAGEHPPPGACAKFLAAGLVKPFSYLRIAYSTLVAASTGRATSAWRFTHDFMSRILVLMALATYVSRICSAPMMWIVRQMSGIHGMYMPKRMLGVLFGFNNRELRDLGFSVRQRSLLSRTVRNTCGPDFWAVGVVISVTRGFNLPLSSSHVPCSLTIFAKSKMPCLLSQLTVRLGDLMFSIPVSFAMKTERTAHTDRKSVV